MQPLRTIYELARETFREFGRDHCSRLGAALAYYVLLSLAPLLLVVIGVVGLFTQRDAARTQVVAQFRELVGPEGAQSVESMLDSTKSPTGGVISTVVGVALLIFGATGVFAQLQDALNVVWKVPPRKAEGLGLWTMVRSRLLSFSVVLGLGFLLLVSLVAGAMLAGIRTWLSNYLGDVSVGLEVLNMLLSFALATLLFALIYKVLPDAQVSWRGVWIGAVVTSLLFNLGKYLIGLYLGQTAPGSSFGAAGSLVVLLVWIFYSTQLLLIGAEFTKVYEQGYQGGLKYDALTPQLASG